MEKENRNEFLTILRNTAGVAHINYNKFVITKEQLEAIKEMIFFQASFVCDMFDWAKFCDDIENIILE